MYFKFRRYFTAPCMAPDGTPAGGATSSNGEPTPADTMPPDSTPAPQPTTPPSFADIIKDKTMQADLDRYVDKALKTARAKWENEAQTRIADAQTEAQRLAQMSADERAKEEQAKQAKALADREADITRRELHATALDTLAARELPRELAELLVYTDADACSASIDAAEKAFRAAVQAGVETRLKGKTPPAGGAPATINYNAQIEAATKAGDFTQVAYLTRLQAQQK